MHRHVQTQRNDCRACAAGQGATTASAPQAAVFTCCASCYCHPPAAPPRLVPGVPLKRKVAEFRVTPDALLPVGHELRASHFVAGQFVDVTGTSIGKGFQVGALGAVAGAGSCSRCSWRVCMVGPAQLDAGMPPSHRRRGNAACRCAAMQLPCCQHASWHLTTASVPARLHLLPQGVMKRWGFSGQPASHGNSLAHRAAGSTGACQVRHRELWCLLLATRKCVLALHALAAPLAVFVPRLHDATWWPGQAAKPPARSTCRPLLIPHLLHPASLQDPGKVFKGKKMPGRLGGERVTVQNCQVRCGRELGGGGNSCACRSLGSCCCCLLARTQLSVACLLCLPCQPRAYTADCHAQVFRVDPARNLLYVRGQVPGHKGNWVLVKDRCGREAQ